MASTNLGKIAITNEGIFSTQKTYEKLSIVTYNGSSYCSKQTTLGNYPTDTVFWQLIAKKPEKGIDYLDAAELDAIIAEIADYADSEFNKAGSAALNGFIARTGNIIDKEIARVANENNRLDAEEDRIYTEDLREIEEDDRVLSENSRILQENERIANENIRKSAEATRKTGESARKASEANRVGAENTRIVNEVLRESERAAINAGEQERLVAEINRVLAEDTRVDAEAAREANEEVRISAIRTIEDNENNRISNEENRIFAEELRPNYFYVTQEEYNSLPQADKENPKNIYEVTDSDGEVLDELSGFINGLQTQLDTAISGITTNSEIINARVDKSNTAHPTLKARLDNDMSTSEQSILSLSNQLADIEQQISDNAFIMGVYWNKTSSPVLTRTDASVGKLASVGISGAVVHNDFDNMPIYREMGTVTDTYGNEFVKIPKFYIKKTDGVAFKTIKISKTKYPDYYLPAVFWDFENQVELPYYLHGKYKANLSADNLRLESKPATFPLQMKNIVDFRNYAKANNNVGSALKGYQQLDIHAQDVLYCLFTVEFATLNSQSIMQGFSSGRWTAADLVTVASTAANTIIVANATADLYKVGQTVSLGTSQGGNQVFYGRQITAIAVYDGTNKAITVDGAPFNAAIGNMLYNTGAKSGFSADVNASSGTPIANDGKYPCVYRGIESPWGDMWQFVDGVNITEFQAWVCRNADQYASNVFASPYEKVGYVNGNTNGYLKYKGFDKLYPFAELPKEVGGDSATYYSDYYYQATGQGIAVVGGNWSSSSPAGLSSWHLYYTSSYASAFVGGRLIKKAL